MITHKINLKLPIHHWCKTLNQSCGKSFVQNNKLWTAKLATLKYQIRSAIRRKIFSDKQHDFFKNWFIPRIVFHDFQILPFVDLHSESHPKAMNAKNKKSFLALLSYHLAIMWIRKSLLRTPTECVSPARSNFIVYLPGVKKECVFVSDDGCVFYCARCRDMWGELWQQHPLSYQILCVVLSILKKFLRNVISTDSRREML